MRMMLRQPILSRTWHFFYLHLACHLYVLRCSAQKLQQYKSIDVSAMCSSNGITAQMMFDTPFNGKIYSSRYVTVHDCVYFNNYGENMILFSIPVYNCGTVVEKDNQNIISHIENEVYVQFDKDTQNVDDRRYLFICDRSKTSSNTFRGTVRPGQTIIVQTLAPTRVLATQAGGNSENGSQQQPSVWMEIQEGNSPGRPVVVRRPLQLGDQITLVVSGHSNRPINEYNIFVHTCFASDGSGANRIELTDEAGCTVRTKLADRMKRRKDDKNVISYSLPLTVFKFPTTSDVYFSCAVDVCSTCSFPDLCAAGAGKNFRAKRSLNSSTLDEDMQVHDSIRISEKSESGDVSTCFTQTGLTLMMSIFSLLLASLIFVTVCIVRLYRKQHKSQR